MLENDLFNANHLIFHGLWYFYVTNKYSQTVTGNMNCNAHVGVVSLDVPPVPSMKREGVRSPDGPPPVTGGRPSFSFSETSGERVPRNFKRGCPFDSSKWLNCRVRGFIKNKDRKVTSTEALSLFTELRRSASWRKLQLPEDGAVVIIIKWSQKIMRRWGVADVAHVINVLYGVAM